MLKDFNAIKISIASPEDIINWSHGEVTRAETINYRTFKPEPGGLMAEEIFGPTKDFECYCGKYKKVRYKGIVCDRCNVEVTHKRVRRERMGHIKLAAPVSHVWFSNGIPNKLSMILDIPQKKLETVIYYARYVVTSVDAAEQKKALDGLKELKEKEMAEVEAELEEKIKEIGTQFSEEGAETKKATKDKSKLELQLERIRNNEKTQVARIKSAYKQKQDNVDKKFVDLKSLVEDIKMGSTLSEEEFQLIDNYGFYFYSAGMGAEAIKELLDKLNIEEEVVKLDDEMRTSKSQLKVSKAVQRSRILKGLLKSGVKPSWLILEILPVIPPDIRPIVQLPGGRFATYDLNDLYRRVINRNNRLKRLISLGAPEIILRNEKRMLQEAVDSLLDNNHKPGSPSLNSRGLPYKSLSDMLRGKQGRFRQNLLGKRVDYSANAVIVSGPELRFDQCGIPKTIALEIFRPFIIRELIARGIAANPAKAKLVFESKTDEVWDILEEVSKDRPVLLNRAPTLHRQSILAFYPVLIEGSAIRLHPITCKGFNADFDGDQMAVHLPLSDISVKEVKARMFAKDNILSLRDGSPLIHIGFEMAMGIYFLTKIEGDESKPVAAFGTLDEAIIAYHLRRIKFYEPIKVLTEDGIITTSAGRAIFNKVLPVDYGFVNRVLNKSDISKISADIFNKYGRDESIRVLDEIKSVGFKYAGRYGLSISMEEFDFGSDADVVSELKDFRGQELDLLNQYKEGMITENELKWLRREKWANTADKVQADVWTTAKKNATQLVDLDISGATPVSSWVKKISGVGGYIVDPTGNIVDLPITSNYKTGFSNFEYFVAARGSRKSFADVALRTADSGYLTRRLHDVAQELVINQADCESLDGIFVERTAKRIGSFSNRLKGRYLSEDLANPKTGEVIAKRNDPVTIELSKKIEEISDITRVKIRSPLTCQVAHGVCPLCYGYDLGTGKLVEFGEAVGTIASQALGEPTTQLTLKSKSDARAGKSDITQGLPRVEELFEARTPKALAQLSEIDGVIKVIDEKKRVLLRITGDKKVTKRYKLTGKEEIKVKDGAKVKIGELIGVRGKSELTSEIEGVVTLDHDTLTIDGIKEVEIEKETEGMINLLVKDGDKVKKGDQLTFGSVDPKELAELKSVYEAQKYIVDGVQEVYGIQGLEVDDRHLEIVVRQMTRYGLVSDNGASEDLLQGDYADILEIEKENVKLKEQDKGLIRYKQVLMGVTNSALRTESFLSAASFEQQVRVLTEAALVGKVDHLRGLKENVIIGKLVPIGMELKRKLGLVPPEDDDVLEPQAPSMEESRTFSDEEVERIM